MLANGKVFISHAHDDNQRCEPLLTALTTLGTDYWFDTQQLDAGKMLGVSIQRAIAERGIFIRVCTAASQRSFWVALETEAFRGLQAETFKQGNPNERVLINMIFDANYQREPFDRATIYIDCVTQPQSAWIAELRRALQVDTAGAVSPPIYQAPSNQVIAKQKAPVGKAPPIIPRIPRSFFTFHYPWIIRRLLLIQGLTSVGYLGYVIMDINYARYQCSIGDQTLCSVDGEYRIPSSMYLIVRILELGFWIPAFIILISTLIYTIRLCVTFGERDWIGCFVLFFVIGGIGLLLGPGYLINLGSIGINVSYGAPGASWIPQLLEMGLLYNFVLFVAVFPIWGFAWFGPTTARNLHRYDGTL